MTNDATLQLTAHRKRSLAKRVAQYQISGYTYQSKRRCVSACIVQTLFIRRFAIHTSDKPASDSRNCTVEFTVSIPVRSDAFVQLARYVVYAPPPADWRVHYPGLTAMKATPRSTASLRCRTRVRARRD